MAYSSTLDQLLPNDFLLDFSHTTANWDHNYCGDVDTHNYDDGFNLCPACRGIIFNDTFCGIIRNGLFISIVLVED